MKWMKGERLDACLVNYYSENSSAGELLIMVLCVECFMTLAGRLWLYTLVSVFKNVGF